MSMTRTLQHLPEHTGGVQEEYGKEIMSIMKTLQHLPEHIGGVQEEYGGEIMSIMKTLRHLPELTGGVREEYGREIMSIMKTLHHLSELTKGVWQRGQVHVENFASSASACPRHRTASRTSYGALPASGKLVVKEVRSREGLNKTGKESKQKLRGGSSGEWGGGGGDCQGLQEFFHTIP